jgi:hypothetical protein
MIEAYGVVACRECTQHWIIDLRQARQTVVCPHCGTTHGAPSESDEDVLVESHGRRAIRIQQTADSVHAARRALTKRRAADWQSGGASGDLVARLEDTALEALEADPEKTPTTDADGPGDVFRRRLNRQLIQRQADRASVETGRTPSRRSLKESVIDQQYAEMSLRKTLIQRNSERVGENYPPLRVESSKLEEDPWETRANQRYETFLTEFHGDDPTDGTPLGEIRFRTSGQQPAAACRPKDDIERTVEEIEPLLDALLPALTDLTRSALRQDNPELWDQRDHLTGQMVTQAADYLVDEVGVTAGEGFFAGTMARWALRLSDRALDNRGLSVDDLSERDAAARKRAHEALTRFVTSQGINRWPHGGDLARSVVPILQLHDREDIGHHQPTLLLRLDPDSWLASNKTPADNLFSLLETLQHGCTIEIAAVQRVRDWLSDKFPSRHDDWLTGSADQYRDEQRNRAGEESLDRQLEAYDLLSERQGEKRRSLLLALPTDEWTTVQDLRDDPTFLGSAASLDRWLSEFEADGLAEIDSRDGYDSNRARLTPLGRAGVALFDGMDCSLRHPLQQDLVSSLTEPRHDNVGTVSGTGTRSEGEGEASSDSPTDSTHWPAGAAAAGVPSTEEALTAVDPPEEAGFIQFMGNSGVENPRTQKYPLHQMHRVSSAGEGITILDDLTEPLADQRVVLASYMEKDADLQLATEWGGSAATLVRLASAISSHTMWNRVLTEDRLGSDLSSIVTPGLAESDHVEDLLLRQQLGWPQFSDDDTQDEKHLRYDQWRSRLVGQAASLQTRLAEIDKEDGGEAVSNLYADALGLLTTMTQICHSVDVDVTCHVRLPDPQNILRDEARLDDLLDFFRYTAPKLTCLGSTAAYRHTVETREQKLKHRTSVSLENGVEAATTADWVVQGPGADCLYEEIADAVGEVSPREQVAEGREDAPVLSIPVQTGNHRRHVRKAVEEMLERKGWHDPVRDPDRDMDRVVETLMAVTRRSDSDLGTGSVRATAETLAALSIDGAEAITTRDIEHAIGRLSVDRLLPSVNSPTLKLALQELLVTDSPLSVAELCDRVGCSRRTWERSHRVLEGLALVTRTEEGLIGSLTPWWTDDDAESRRTDGGDAIWPVVTCHTLQGVAWQVALLLDDHDALTEPEGVWTDGVWSKPPPETSLPDYCGLDETLAEWLPVVATLADVDGESRPDSTVATIGNWPDHLDNHQTRVVSGFSKTGSSAD